MAQVNNTISEALRNERVNYTGSDAYIRECLVNRGLSIPSNSNGEFSRKDALTRLINWEQKYKGVDDGVKVRVIFNSSNNPSAGAYVFASINDKNFQAPFDTEVIIPKYFITECIDRAHTIKYENIFDERTGGFKRTKRMIPTYPYQILEEIKPVPLYTTDDTTSFSKTETEVPTKDKQSTK